MLGPVLAAHGVPRIWWTVMSSMPCPKGNHRVHQARRWPSPGDLQVHRGASEAIQRRGNVPSPWGRSQRLLRVASRACSKRGQEDVRLLRLIRASFNASHGIYEAPRVFLDLREAGETCSKHRVARLMRENGLRALHGYRTKRVSIGKPSVLIPDVLQRQLTVSRPNKAWVTDITYIRTWQGWLYLAVVMDLFSRKIIGWSTSPTIHHELVLDAVLTAVRRRHPKNTLIHSDQGTLQAP